jgi:hypothetical protein
MSIPEFKINMNLSQPRDGLRAGTAREILGSYLSDFGEIAHYTKNLKFYSSAYLQRDHRKEVEALRQLLELPTSQMLLAKKAKGTTMSF